MSVRARLERIERTARAHLPHAGEVLAAAWRRISDAELEAIAALGNGPEARAADALAVHLWPALNAHHGHLTRAVADLEHLPPTDARWLMPLPQPSDEAIRDALDVLDASAAPEGAHDAWMLARLAARIAVGVRDAY